MERALGKEFGETFWGFTPMVGRAIQRDFREGRLKGGVNTWGAKGLECPNALKGERGHTPTRLKRGGPIRALGAILKGGDLTTKGGPRGRKHRGGEPKMKSEDRETA